MLYRLEIENFYSIRDPQIIDLRVGSAAGDQTGCLAPLWKDADEFAPKVMALFGANASGKSNVLKALSFIVWFAKDSFSAPRETRLLFDRFNDSDMLKAPTRLSIHLGGVEEIAQIGDPRAAQCGYVYEVTLGGEAPAIVLGEALYYRPSSAARRMKLFERRGDGSVTAAKAFGLGGYHQALDKILRSNASVISTLAQLNHPYAKAIADTASRVESNILIDRMEISDDSMIRFYADRPKLVELLNSEIEKIDLGVASMQVHPGANGPVAMFAHHGLALPMHLFHQSHGTRQFLKLYPFLLSALESGGVALLDELDAAIHPLILPEIVRWFRDPVRNPLDAQLWMTCHNASLLEDLSKEEIVFCDKDARGRTEIYGLRDIQAVRRSDNFYKKYLGGAFGAVPQIG